MFINTENTEELLSSGYNNILLEKVGTIIKNETLDETDYNYIGKSERKLNVIILI